jgi:hypothetical protein
MKNVIRFLLTLAAVAALSGCAHTRSNTRTEKEGTQLFMVEGFESLAASPPKQQGVETMVIEEAVKLGIKAAKKLIEAEAKKYEANFQASMSGYWRGMDRLAGDPLATDWLLSEGKFVVFSRSISNSSDGLGWSWTNSTTKSQLVSEILNSSSSWIQMPSKESTALKDALYANLPTKGYPTFLVVFVIAPHRKTAQAMEVSLLGYMYPALKAKRSSIHIPFTKWHKVDSAVTVHFMGPEGQRGFPSGKYDSAAAFDLGDVVQKDNWVGFKRGEKASIPLAIPSANVLTTEVKVVESSNMKKKIEALAEAVGKLKPEDLGLKKDGK